MISPNAASTMFLRRLALLVLAGFLLSVGTSTMPFGQSSEAQGIEELRQQSEELEEQIDQANQNASQLNQRADDLEGALAQLNTDINQAEDRITRTNERIDSLQKDLDEAKSELERQKGLLKASMRALYKRGGASTVEMLVASDSFSEFIDEQEYLDRLKSAIQDSTDEVIELREQIEEQKKEQEGLLQEQEAARNQLTAARSERRQLLNETVSEEERLREHSRALAEKQREVNQELLRQSRLVSSTGSGSYPWSNAVCASTGSQSGGCWNYEWYVDGGVLDPWGYYYRNCTSYVAWKSAQMGLELSGRGSLGNGGQWSFNAYKYNLPTGYTPKVGAFAVFTTGGYGHVAYVEDVADGEVLISEYNFVADGVYSERWIPMNGGGSATSYVYPPWAQ